MTDPSRPADPPVDPAPADLLKPRAHIAALRAYWEGRRVVLDAMDDPYADLRRGSTGVVADVDDGGTLHVDWDEGAHVGLIPGVDRFHAAGG